MVNTRNSGAETGKMSNSVQVFQWLTRRPFSEWLDNLPFRPTLALSDFYSVVLTIVNSISDHSTCLHITLTSLPFSVTYPSSNSYPHKIFQTVKMEDDKKGIPRTKWRHFFSLTPSSEVILSGWNYFVFIATLDRGCIYQVCS